MFFSWKEDYTCVACLCRLEHKKQETIGDFARTCPFPFTAPTATPQNPLSTTLNATAIQVQWETVPEIDRNGIITFFEVRVHPVQFQDISYINVSGSELVLVVGGLEEFVEYSFTIRAYTIAGPGKFSDVTTSTTNQAGKRNACGCVEDACIVTVLIHLLLLEVLNPT